MVMKFSIFCFLLWLKKKFESINYLFNLYYLLYKPNLL